MTPIVTPLNEIWFPAHTNSNGESQNEFLQEMTQEILLKTLTCWAGAVQLKYKTLKITKQVVKNILNTLF